VLLAKLVYEQNNEPWSQKGPPFLWFFRSFLSDGFGKCYNHHIPCSPISKIIPLTPIYPNFNMHFNIKAKMLFKMIEIHIVSTQKRMGILLHFWTTYKWIENHCVLLIVVTSVVVITMKVAITNVYFHSLQQNNMHYLCHPPSPWVI
jgi:hypothetical protein